MISSGTAKCRPLQMPSQDPADEPGAGKPSLAAVFEAEESPLLRYAFGLVGRRAVAEDLVQDAFLRLHEQWAEVENPRAWLFRCVRNRAYNHLRDHKRETLSGETDRDGDEGREAPDETLGRLEAAGMVHLLLGELDQRDRELIHLKYFEDLKYSQISQRTSMSVGNVGYRLHHILKSLAEGLRKAGIEGGKQ